MSFKDSMMSFWNKMRQGPVVTDGLEANLANGGHTGYHPPVPPRQRPVQNTGFQPAYDPNFYQNTGFQQNYQPDLYPQQPAFQQNTAYQQPAQMTGYQPAQGMSWQNQGGFAQNQQTGFMQGQQGGFAQNQQTGFMQGQQGGFAQNQQTGFMQGQQGGFAQNQQTGFQNAWQTAYQQPAPAAQEQPAQQGPYQTEGNVTYAFGQSFRSEQGVAYNHVERLAQPLSVATCFRLIEFMRNGESIIVNLELVSDENERTRCLDMLCGAAFTMQCTFTRVASRCIYLIAPHTVLVAPYESIRQMNEQDAESRWGKREGTTGEVRTNVRWGTDRRSRQREQVSDFDDRRYSYQQ